MLIVEKQNGAIGSHNTFEVLETLSVLVGVDHLALPIASYHAAHTVVEHSGHLVHEQLLVESYLCALDLIVLGRIDVRVAQELAAEAAEDENFVVVEGNRAGSLALWQLRLGELNQLPPL